MGSGGLRRTRTSLWVTADGAGQMGGVGRESGTHAVSQARGAGENGSRGGGRRGDDRGEGRS